MEVQAADFGDGQPTDIVAAALDEVLEAVAEPDDLQVVIDGFDGDRADDAVNSRGRPAAHDQGEFACRRHAASKNPWSIVCSINLHGSLATDNGHQRSSRARRTSLSQEALAGRGIRPALSRQRSGADKFAQ